MLLKLKKIKKYNSILVLLGNRKQNVYEIRRSLSLTFFQQFFVGRESMQDKKKLRPPQHGCFDFDGRA